MTPQEINNLILQRAADAENVTVLQTTLEQAREDLATLRVDDDHIFTDANDLYQYNASVNRLKRNIEALRADIEAIEIRRGRFHTQMENFLPEATWLEIMDEDENIIHIGHSVETLPRGRAVARSVQMIKNHPGHVPLPPLRSVRPDPGD